MLFGFSVYFDSLSNMKIMIWNNYSIKKKGACNSPDGSNSLKNKQKQHISRAAASVFSPRPHGMHSGTVPSVGHLCFGITREPNEGTVTARRAYEADSVFT